jgi:hypothetical protein
MCNSRVYIYTQWQSHIGTRLGKWTPRFLIFIKFLANIAMILLDDQTPSNFIITPAQLSFCLQRQFFITYFFF